MEGVGSSRFIVRKLVVDFLLVTSDNFSGNSYGRGTKWKGVINEWMNHFATKCYVEGIVSANIHGPLNI